MCIRDFHLPSTAFLSNFYPAPTEWDGVLYPTAEHAYQAAKTTDLLERAMLLAPGLTPGQAKRLGRQLTIRSGWNDIKGKVMHRVVHDKFTRNLDLHALLASTAPLDLVEGNTWHDNYWGSCSCPRCRTQECASNTLGRILVYVRDHT